MIGVAFVVLLAAAVAGSVWLVRRWPRWRAADRVALKARVEDERRQRREVDRRRLVADVVSRQAALRARREAEQLHPSAASDTYVTSSRRDGPEPRAVVAKMSLRSQIIAEAAALAALDEDLVYDPAVWEAS